MTAADRRLVIIEVFAGHDRKHPTLSAITKAELVCDTLARDYGLAVHLGEVLDALAREAGFLD